jgi:hypothetical protein
MSVKRQVTVPTGRRVIAPNYGAPICPGNIEVPTRNGGGSVGQLSVGRLVLVPVVVLVLDFPPVFEGRGGFTN